MPAVQKTTKPEVQTPVVSGLPKPATLDRLKKKQRATTTMVVYLDPEAAAEVVRLEGELYEAKERNDADAIVRLEAELTAATAVRDAEAVTLKLRALGRKRFDALKDAHPPTPEQTAEFQKETAGEDGTPSKDVPEYNADTFPVALISASLIDPVLSEDEVREVTEDWNFNEFLQLHVTCIALNSTSRVDHWGKASG